MASLDDGDNLLVGPDIKSGSGWEADELDIYRFEKAPKQHLLEDFPWRELLENPDSDPIADVTATLSNVFAVEPASGGPSKSGNARTFFDMLRVLTSQFVPWNATDVPQTRSHAVDYSSPSLPSAATLGFEGQTRWDLDSDIPGPVTAFIQRRGQKFGDAETTASTGLDHEGTSESLNYLFSSQPLSQDRNSGQPLEPEACLPSSESGSSYRATSSPSAVINSSPPTIRAPAYIDQAESGINTMMYVLLSSICDIISEAHVALSAGIEFLTSSNAETLLVPIGDRSFTKTTPDLIVFIERNEYSMTILDYEGKRLRPNMTPTEKYAQSVAHLLGRAARNRATGATSSRRVYLLTAQHTSVSIMQCTLLHKWLDRLPANLDSLKSFARVQVQDYRPLDLADGVERLLAVQMICRLLLALSMEAKLVKTEG